MLQIMKRYDRVMTKITGVLVEMLFIWLQKYGPCVVFGNGKKILLSGGDVGNYGLLKTALLG